MNLDGETALVTGSSRNIGQEIAVTLAEAGADIGITAREDRSGCEETKSMVLDTGSDAIITLGDLGTPSDIKDVVRTVEEELGPITILVNNASIRPFSQFLDFSVEEWDRVHNVNLRSQALLCKYAIPGMIENGGGSILNIVGSSIYSGALGKTHVMANKAGIPGLTRGIALEYGPDGINANAVCLGLISTERDMENYSEFEETKRRFEQSSALRRVGTPQEVANICLFLASDYSSLITGQVIHANAGTYPIRDSAD